VGVPEVMFAAYHMHVGDAVNTDAGWRALQTLLARCVGSEEKDAPVLDVCLV